MEFCPPTDSYLNNMRYLFVLIGSFLLLLTACKTPQTQSQNAKEIDVQIVFYNVENLFDTIDAPGKWDEEFTPNSKKQWNTEKYHTKLGHLAAVIDSIGQDGLPDIIGLEEVENRAVLEDLVLQPALVEAQYKIIHYESPDFRGIDNALLYRPDVFEVLHQEAIPVNMPDEIAIIGKDTMTTRDHLYVKGILHRKDTLHIFVNHWTSMYYGAEETVPHRNFCADVLKTHVDSIFSKDSNANILIGGDLNEDVFAPAAIHHLKADTIFTNIQNKQLYNLAYYFFTQKNQATYNYKGEWGVLDHIIVSGSLLNKTNAAYTQKEWASVFDSDLVMNYYNNRYGKGKRPNRTYAGNNYYGGYSDHLPVYLNLKVVP